MATKNTINIHTSTEMLQRRDSTQSLPDSYSDDSGTLRSGTDTPPSVEEYKALPLQPALPQLPSLVRALTAPLATAVHLARLACLKALANVQTGHIRVIDETVDGKVAGQQSLWTFGEAPGLGVTTATIRVLKKRFWARLVVYSSLGFGESFMLNEVEVDDLTALIVLFIRNRNYLAAMEVLPFGLNSVLNSIVHSPIPNTIYNSLLNIQAHYDLGNEMFESFLSPDMTYSCPIWKVGSPDEEESLEDAQMRKIRRMLELADVREGDHLLEIGTGWGALSIEAVRKYNCHVTTLTLSKEQKALAEARIAKAGYSDRITVLLKDYRLLDPAQYQFDRIVTVEMLEAVGREFMPTFFKHMNALLKPRGVLSLQVITIADARFEAYTKAQDFIQKYIFPGGQCPCVASLTEAVYKGSGGELIVDELHNIGPHYAKALRLWREEFVDKFDAVRDATGLHSVYTREFMRRWEYYFAYCEAGFITRALGDVQVRLVKECNEDLVAGIPL